MSMMPIKVFKGFVIEFDNGSNSSGDITGLVVTTFSVGDPPVNFWSPFSLGSPIASGDYVAVAGKRSLVPGVDYVALAYRRLGTSGNAQLFNAAFPVMCILFGVLGAFGGLFLGPLNACTKPMTAVLIALGLFGIWRLWSMYAARRILNSIESVLSTYQQEQ